VSGLKNGFAGVDGELQAAGLKGDGVGHRPILTEARDFPKRRKKRIGIDAFPQRRGVDLIRARSARKPP
jgi:hypothetical protein